MFVTIYTDASYHPDTGQGAGAFWAKSDRGVIKGRTVYDSENSTHAEMQIIYIALKKVLEEWGMTKVVLVRTDCLAVCHWMWPFHKASPKGMYQSGRDHINNLLDKHGVKARFKHIKGHQHPNNSAGAYLNNWCDDHAGRARRRAEKQEPRVESTEGKNIDKMIEEDMNKLAEVICGTRKV